MNKNFTIGGTQSGTLAFGASSKTLTVSETCTINQNLQTTATPTFSSLGLEGASAYLTLKNSTDENGDGEAETRILFRDHANNTFSTPIYLKKAALLAFKLNDLSKAKSLAERLKSQFPDSPESVNIDGLIGLATK